MPIQNMYNISKLLTNQESQYNCCQLGAAIGGEGMFWFTPLYDNCCGLGVTVPGGREMPMLNIFKIHKNSTASARFGELDYMMLSRSLVSLTQLSAVLACIFPQSSRGSYRKASRYRKRYIWACCLLDSVRMRFHENCDHCLCKSSISKQCGDQICDGFSKQTSRT